MKIKHTVDLGEYKVVIDYDASGNGHLVIEVFDELEDSIDGLEIQNETDDEDDTDS